MDTSASLSEAHQRAWPKGRGKVGTYGARQIGERTTTTPPQPPTLSVYHVTASPSPFVRRRGPAKDGHHVDVVAIVERIEEDAVISNASSVAGFGRGSELENVAGKRINPHGFDGSINAGEVMRG